MHVVGQYYKKTWLFVSLGIFSVVFVLLGLPFTRWGFLHDDFGVVYHALIAGGSNLKALFTEGSMTAVVQPSNYIIPEQSFFAVLYRPLVYLFLHVQMLVFGVNPYALLLVTIFFHALNAVLLFLFLLAFMPLLSACITALLFAFHLSYWDWMGWIAGQNQVVNFTLVICILMLVKRYVDDGRVCYLVPAWLLFTVSLFYREEALILPVWLLLSVPVYFIYQNKFISWHTVCKQLAIVTSGFWLATAFYFAMRMACFPLQATGAGIKGHVTIFGFLASLRYRFFDVVTFLSDIANIAWLPGGNRLLKGSLLGFFLLVLVWLFYKNKQKLLLLFCLLSMTMFMWPAVWRYYSSRFLYLGLPFLLVALVLMVTQYRYKNSESKQRWLKIHAGLGVLLIVLNTCLLVVHLKQRERELAVTAEAFSALAHDERIQGKALCFIGLPYETFVTGVAQAMWLQGLSPDIPVYYDNTSFVWRNKNFRPNDFKISRVPGGFRLISIASERAWFSFTNTCMPMGTKVVHAMVGEKITDMMYFMDLKYFGSDCVWITWDYGLHRFVLCL